MITDDITRRRRAADAGRSAAVLLMSDVDVPYEESVGLLTAAIAQDLAEGRALPSDEQLELLIMGGEDGAVPSELIAMFPRLDEALESFF